MARLRISPMIRSINSIRSSPRLTSSPIYNQQPQRYASSSYGGGEGDPKGANPQDQGSNPSADLEHPGPPPPDVGQGTGGGPTKKGAEGHNTQQNASSDGPGDGNRQGSAGGGAGAKPKLGNDNDGPSSPEQSDEVRAHNEEMGKRHDRAEEKSADSERDDKVHPGYWSGE